MNDSQERQMARKPKPRVDLKDPKNAAVIKLAEQLRQEVRRRHGTDLSYEQRRDAAMGVMGDVLWPTRRRTWTSS